jgi:hypothetical protein
MDSKIPSRVFDALSKGLGATYDEESAYSYVPCSYRNSNVLVIYTFGGPNGVNITVPLSELIGHKFNDQSAYENGTPACSFNFVPSSDDTMIILGHSFLRSAYVVYDLENAIIAMAQAKLGGKASIDGPDVIPIPSGTTLPGVTRTAMITVRAVAATGPYSAELGVASTPTFNLPGVTITPNAEAEKPLDAGGQVRTPRTCEVMAAIGLLTVL